MGLARGDSGVWKGGEDLAQQEELGRIIRLGAVESLGRNWDASVWGTAGGSHWVSGTRAMAASGWRGAQK